jgi:hypothetical protein
MVPAAARLAKAPSSVGCRNRKPAANAALGSTFCPSISSSARIRTTAGAHFGTINAANLLRAHAWIESGKARGKVVLEGF